MVSKKTMLRGFATAGLLLLVSASLMPLVAAEPSEKGSDRRAEKMKRGQEVSLSLYGTLTTRDNESYTYTIEAQGKARVKMDDEAPEKIRGVFKAHVIIKDSDGNVVKDRTVRLFLRAHEVDNDTWQWMIVSNKGQRDRPHLVLRGEAALTDGTLRLEGEGRVLFRLDDERVKAAATATGQLVRA